MRLITTALAVLMSSAAYAASLPVSRGAVYCGDSLSVSADGVSGEDLECVALSPATSEGVVVLQCEYPEPGYGDPWTEAVTIIEDPATNTLTYIDEDGPVILERCE